MNARWGTLALVLVAGMTTVARAQEAPPPPDPARAEQLRGEIERRFAERVRVELGLNDEQMSKLHATNQKFAGERRAVMLRQRELRLALQQQMRPGVAADADSVRRLNEALRDNRTRLFELEQTQEREMAEYLSPVQVAQYRMLRERLLQRVEDLRRNRPGMGQGTGPRPGGGAPGQRPRVRRPR
jgi:hypothetical protein